MINCTENYDIKYRIGSGRLENTGGNVLAAKKEANPTQTIFRLSDKLNQSDSIMHIQNIEKAWRKVEWAPRELSEENKSSCICISQELQNLEAGHLFSINA